MVQIRAIVAKEGITGLYAGYGAFMLRDLPFDAIEFVAYEQVRPLSASCLAACARNVILPGSNPSTALVRLHHACM
jgi:hypothetical protein